jgi:uncharacterized damage-inducible protein DinB
MRLSDRIVDQLERGYDGDAWHGSPLGQIVSGLTAEAAAARLIPGAHSIWELVLHLTAWKGEIRERLKGKSAGQPPAGDFPPVPVPTEAAWSEAKAALEREHRELVRLAGGLSDSELDQPVNDLRPGGRGAVPTSWQTLQGILQHDAYHAGQIALLQKLVSRGA